MEKGEKRNQIRHFVYRLSTIFPKLRDILKCADVSDGNGSRQEVSDRTSKFIPIRETLFQKKVGGLWDSEFRCDDFAARLSLFVFVVAVKVGIQIHPQSNPVKVCWSELQVFVPLLQEGQQFRGLSSNFAGY